MPYSYIGEKELPRLGYEKISRERVRQIVEKIKKKKELLEQ
jgi:hypothetical protein